MAGQTHISTVRACRLIHAEDAAYIQDIPAVRISFSLACAGPAVSRIGVV
jgi:hypothetical protein